MHHVLRRAAIAALLTTTGVVSSPLTGVGHAATFSGTITTNPASESANSTTYVYANRPLFVATYTGALDPSSTITVMDGSTMISCPPVVSGSTVDCTPDADLISGHTYAVTSHGVQASDGTQADAPAASFVDAHPTLKLAVPASGNSLVDGTQPLTATFTDPLRMGAISTDKTKSTFRLYDPVGNLIADENSGPETFSASTTATPPATAPTDTINLAHPKLGDGKYEAKVHVDGVTSGGADAPAAHADLDYVFWVSSGSPASLTGPSVVINSQTIKAIPFSGTAAPGLTVTVTVTDSAQAMDGSHPTATGPDMATNSVTVPDCGSNDPVCPWQLTVDGTAAKDSSVQHNTTRLVDGTETWTATATDANGKSSAAAAGQSFQLDATVPNAPTVSSPAMANGSSTLTMSATDSSTDVVSYHIAVSDQDGHSLPTRDVAASTSLPTQTFDASALDDGGITIQVTVTDSAGNVSAIGKTTNTKNVGVQPEFDSSTILVRGTDIPFAAAESHPIQPPTSITVAFSEPLIPQWCQATAATQSDPCQGTVHKSSICVVAGAGTPTCLPGTLTFSSDARSMTLALSGTLTDAGSPYSITVDAWPKNFCSNVPWNTLNNSPGTVNSRCTDYNGPVLDDNSQPFSFTVDSQPPGTPVISTIPQGTIDGSNVGDVLISGTVANAGSGATVTLFAKSSGGGAVLALNGGQPIPVDNQGNWQDRENNAALAALPDGTVTISGTAVDAAQNASQVGTDTVTLAARPGIVRSLAVSVTDSSFTLHWLAPSYDGFPALQNGNATSHLTGYTYTYQDTTNGAVDTSLHSVDVDDPNAVSATQAGLLPGHTYNVTLCALNGVDGPCNKVATTATPAYATSITANVSKALVVYGNPITLSGRLTRNDIGAGIANEPLTVTPRFDNGSLGPVLHLTTDSFGSWSTTIAKPAKDALYLVAFDADNSDPTYQASNSAVRSLVEVSLRIDKVTAKSSSHTAPITVTGHISPSQAGRVVNIYARAAGANHYQRIASVKISSTSTWAYSHAFGKGKFYLFANFATQNGNVGGNSQSVSFTRT